MLRHPVPCVSHLKGIREASVREDVDKKLSVWPQPARDALKQGFPIAHVLEHFHGHHAVIAPFSVERIHVRCNDAHVDESALRRARFDESPLRRRIRHSGYAAIRKLLRHPQRERAPTAAQFQNVLTVRKLVRARTSDAASLLPPRQGRRNHLNKMPSCISSAVRARFQKKPRALHSAARWRSPCATRWGCVSFPRRTPATWRDWRRRCRGLLRGDVPAACGESPRESHNRERARSRSAAHTRSAPSGCAWAAGNQLVCDASRAGSDETAPRLATVITLRLSSGTTAQTRWWFAGTLGIPLPGCAAPALPWPESP